MKLNSNLGSGNVLNTNKCEISVCETRIKNRIVIFSALDNLIKGASGQAIQNMNLVYNFPENLGLKWKTFSYIYNTHISACSKSKQFWYGGSCLYKQNWSKTIFEENLVLEVKIIDGKKKIILIL